MSQDDEATTDESTGSTDLSRAELELQVARVLASPGFVASQRLRRFVRFTVEATISGRSDRIKEYVLGTEVFDRGESYDPRLDPIVRVEAGRLRSKLDHYYHGEGRDDPIRIRYPKGGYVPLFERRENGLAASAERAESGVGLSQRAWAGQRARWGFAIAAIAAVTAGLLWWGSGASPQNRRATAEVSAAGRQTEALAAESGADTASSMAVAVLPLEEFAKDSQAPLADAVTEALITELSTVAGLQVRSRTTTMQYKGVSRPVAEIAEELRVRHLVEGGVIQKGEMIHLQLRLVDAPRDTKIWARSYRCSRQEIVPLQRQVARDISKVLLGSAATSALPTAPA